MPSRIIDLATNGLNLPFKRVLLHFLAISHLAFFTRHLPFERVLLHFLVVSHLLEQWEPVEFSDSFLSVCLALISKGLHRPLPMFELSTAMKKHFQCKGARIVGPHANCLIWIECVKQFETEHFWKLRHLHIKRHLKHDISGSWDIWNRRSQDIWNIYGSWNIAETLEAETFEAFLEVETLHIKRQPWSNVSKLWIS